jgi:hypothetical protein
MKPSPLLNPLLRALEMITFIARHLHPPDFADLMASIGVPDYRADVDLAKDVGICAISVLFSVEKIGVPQDWQLRLLYADDAAELV